jgi:hypothetical protein
MTSEQAATITAVAAVASTAILAIAAVFAGFQVREARRLREARFRPFVVVDFDPASDPPFIHLVISNLGPVVARDVSFVFTPELSSSFDDRPVEGAPPRFAELKLFREGLPTLAPGKRIDVLFDSWIHRGERPDAYTVNVTYRGEGHRSYREEIRLDLAPFRYLRRIERPGLHDIHGELDRIRRELHGWTAPGGGLRVKSPEDIRREREEWERERGEWGAGDEGGFPGPSEEGT